MIVIETGNGSDGAGHDCGDDCVDGGGGVNIGAGGAGREYRGWRCRR